jgi:hypothetical protein
MPEEQMLMNFSLQPRSVYYRWLDEKNAGRECVYVEGLNEGKLITRGGKSDFMLVGRRIAVDPEGLLARSKSRYSITEAGLDNMVRRLERKVALQEKGDGSQGTVKYLGTQKVPEYPEDLLHLVNEIPPGADPVFPKGALRHWYFEPTSGRLVLLHATDPRGEFLEHYLFDRFIPNAALGDPDFNPDQLWPNQKQEPEPQAPARRKTASLPTPLPK